MVYIIYTIHYIANIANRACDMHTVYISLSKSQLDSLVFGIVLYFKEYNNIMRHVFKA